MKKLTIVLTAGLFLLTFAGNVMASTAVSKMATEKGGKAVAECAQTMTGVNECAQMLDCQ